MPTDWQVQVVAVARTRAEKKVLISKHSTSREASDDYELPTASVSGLVVESELPWLRELYETVFREFAEQATSEPISLMSDRRFGVALNVQSAGSRYESHVDSNPVEGLLYVTTHREGEGGELVVSNRGDTRGIADIDADATIIEPKAGHLLFFDGRAHSHYVAALRDPNALRVVAAMNYYTASCPESTRPQGLNRHLSGSD